MVLDQREPDGEFRAFAEAFASNGHTSPVQADQLLHERKADSQATSPLRLSVGTLGEQLEDLRLEFRCDAFAAVFDADDCVAWLAVRLEPDRPAPRCVLDRVAQQIGDDLLESVLVEVELDWHFGQDGLKEDTSGFSLGPRGLECLGQFFLQDVALGLKTQFPCVGPGHVHQVVQESLHCLDLPIDDSQVDPSTRQSRPPACQ